MSEKEKGSHALVRNPLTVISIFAGLAEVSATVALPQLSAGAQELFIWFVMLFPALLVLLFFLTLWTRHHVLYAPSDFVDESNFMRNWVPSTARVEEKEDLSVEVATEEQALPAPPAKGEDNSADQASAREAIAQLNASRAREGRWAEDVVIRRMSQKLGLKFVRDVELRGRSDIRYDAIAESPSGPVMVEVRLLSNRLNALMVVRRELERLAAVSYRLSREEIHGARLVLAMVLREELPASELSQLKNRIRDQIHTANLPMQVEIELIPIAELKLGEQL